MYVSAPHKPTNGVKCPHPLIKMSYEASMNKTNSPLTSEIIGESPKFHQLMCGQTTVITGLHIH